MKKMIFLFFTIGLFIGLGSMYLIYKDDGEVIINEEALPWDLYDEYYLKSMTIIDSILLNDRVYGISKSDEVTLDDLTDEEKNAIVATYAYKKDMLKKGSLSFTKYDLLSLELFGKTIEKGTGIETYSGFVLVKDKDNKKYDIAYVLKEYIEFRSVVTNKVKGAYKYGDTIYFDIPITYRKQNNGGEYYSSDSKFEKIYCGGYECINKLKYKTYRITFNLDKEDSKYKFVSSKVVES